MKRINTVIILFTMLCLLAGCKSVVQGTYLTDDEVIEEIQKFSGTETVSIVEKTEESSRVKYKMRTSERGIEFDIASIPVGKSGGFNFAHVSINDYLTAVQQQYKPGIEELMNDLVLDGGAVAFSNRDELRTVCEKFAEMDAYYKQELKYHDAEFLKSYPASRIVISRREVLGETGDFSYTIPIDGTIDAAELEQFILDLYKERTGKDLQ